MLEHATEHDIPKLVSLINRAYRGAGGAGGWNSEAGLISGDRTTVDLLRREIQQTPHAAFLKWFEPDGSDPVGCVWLEPLADGIWYLGTLAADPSAQGTGMGKSILAAAERWVMDRGGSSIRMTVVNVRDTLIAWYLRRGYRLTGETEPFPYDDNRFGTPLRPDLEFVVLVKDLAT